MPFPFVRKFRQPFTEAQSWLIATLFVWNVIRGFALHMEPYGLGQYFYTYQDGFLIRGLMGSLVTWVAGPAPMSMYAFLEWFTVLEYGVFVVVLLVTFSHLRAADANHRELQNLLFLVLLSGPLMVGIGATRGFHDVLTLSLGLPAYLAFQRDRLLLATALLALATLIHEQIAFFLYPPLGWLLWTDARRRGLRLPLAPTLALGAMCAITMAVTWLGKADAQQLQTLLDKVTEAIQTPYLDKWADPYLTALAAINDVFGNISLDNFSRFQIFPGHYLLLATTLLLWAIGAMVLVRTRAWPDLVVFSLANALPFTLLLFAYDAHRYTVLSTLSSYLICARTWQLHGEVSPPRHLTPILIVAILMQTAMWNYDPIFFNARNSTPLLEFIRTYIDPSLVPMTRVGQPHP